MSLSVAMLIASEFMPASLLTPMAEGLAATEGQTGQAISVSGFFAVVASLAIGAGVGNVNRKWVLTILTALMLLSLVLVALAPNFAVLMLAFGQSAVFVALMLAVWGAMNTVLSITWMTWISQNVEDAPEAAGSLMVASIQGAILFGGAFGGFLFDYSGISTTFIGSIILSAIALSLIGSGARILNSN